MRYHCVSLAWFSVSAQDVGSAVERRYLLKRAILTLSIIGAATAAVSWARARVAPPPRPSGARAVVVRNMGRGNLYLPVGRDTLPTLLFSPGLGVEVSAYNTFLTDIASHGFIVVAVPYPPIRIEGNSDYLVALPMIARGSSDVVDRIAAGTDSLLARVDTSRVAAIGHSFGGAAAALACADRRIKAAVDLDGSLYGRVVHEGVHCPFLLIERSLSRHDTIDMPIFYEDRSQGRLHEDSLIAHSELVEWVTIDDLDHMSFTDGGVAFDSWNWMRDAVRVRLNGAVAQRITADLAMEFLARHLGVKLADLRSPVPLPRGVLRIRKPRPTSSGQSEAPDLLSPPANYP